MEEALIVDNKSSSKQIKFGIVLQYMQMALSILINLIYTPIMLNILGQTEYGIYNLASSIISYLNLLSLGFGASYLRYYSKYKKEKNDEEVHKLNALYLYVFVFIGIVALICGSLISNNIEIFFNSSYSAADMNIARILMIFLTVNLSISFPASVFVSYITSQEKFIFQKLVNMGKTILSPCLTIVMLLLGYGSIGMVIMTTAVSIIIDIINVYYCVAKLKMRFKFSKPNFSLLKDIGAFSIFIAMNQIIDQINWQADKIILGKMMNSAAVAIYAVSSTVNTMYVHFSKAISSVFAPKIHKLIASKKETVNEDINKLFIKVGRMQFMVMMLILTGFIFFGKTFILKWAGEGYELSYYICLLIMIPYIVPLTQTLGIEIQRAKFKHQFRSVVYLIMALMNIVISIIACKYLGVIGVTLGTTISLIVANGIIMNIYYHKKLDINIVNFWKEILIMCKGLIIPTVVGIILYNLQSLHILVYLACIVVYSGVYVLSVCLLSTNKEEKKYIKTVINKVLFKLKIRRKLSNV